MSKTKMSLGNFLLLCFLVLFIALYSYERFRTDRVKLELQESINYLEDEISYSQVKVKYLEYKLESAAAGIRKKETLGIDFENQQPKQWQSEAYQALEQQVQKEKENLKRLETFLNSKQKRLTGQTTTPSQ